MEAEGRSISVSYNSSSALLSNSAVHKFEKPWFLTPAMFMGEQRLRE